MTPEEQNNLRPGMRVMVNINGLTSHRDAFERTHPIFHINKGNMGTIVKIDKKTIFIPVRLDHEKGAITLFCSSYLDLVEPTEEMPKTGITPASKYLDLLK